MKKYLFGLALALKEYLFGLSLALKEYLFGLALALKEYLFGLALALDLLVNAAFGGERYQTISARWGESNTRVWLWKWAADF